MQGVRGACVVITGASSGIGRATARAFAERGAHLVLAARRAEVLDDVVRECERRGGQAIAVPTDVTDQEAVAALRRRAIEHFGGIDVWVNNAGVGAIGAYQDVPLDLHLRTVEVNLLGGMYGAYEALPVFLRQGHGTLINTISIGAFAPTPFAAAYTASKFGLRGFAASLRQELVDHPDIHVCSVFPAVVDTPGLEHGANHSGRRIDPGAFIYAPEDVAATILDLVRRPRAEVAVGWPAQVAKIAYGLAPGLTERAIGAALRHGLARAERAPLTDGSLRRPVMRGTAVSGGWRERKGAPSTGKISAAILALAGVALLVSTSAAASRRAR